MTDGLSSDFFANDRHWLEHQPGLHLWDSARHRLSRQLDDWLAAYSESICERKMTAEQDGYSACVGRLWGCWCYHWRQAAEMSPEGRIDGWQVARQIQSGRGYVYGGQLGGDPLRDIVLAMAVVRRDNRATGRLQEDYFDFSKRIASKLSPRFLVAPDEWWSEFIDHLAGYSRPPGKLMRFNGKCALRNWLGTVLWRFLSRWPLPTDNVLEDLENVKTTPSPTSDPAMEECLDRFSQLVSQALDDLPDDERLVLCLLYIDQLSAKEAASILGVHPGNAGRLRERAIQHLHELLGRRAAEAGREQSYRASFDFLAVAPNEFADALYEALERHRPQESRP